MIVPIKLLLLFCFWFVTDSANSYIRICFWSDSFLKVWVGIKSSLLQRKQQTHFLQFSIHKINNKHKFENYFQVHTLTLPTQVTAAERRNIEKCLKWVQQWRHRHWWRHQELQVLQLHLELQEIRVWNLNLVSRNCFNDLKMIYKVISLKVICLKHL